MAALELDNLITNPRKEKRKIHLRNVFENEDLALLIHISFNLVTKNCS